MMVGGVLRRWVKLLGFWLLVGFDLGWVMGRRFLCDRGFKGLSDCLIK